MHECLKTLKKREKNRRKITEEEACQEGRYEITTQQINILGHGPGLGIGMKSYSYPVLSFHVWERMNVLKTSKKG